MATQTVTPAKTTIHERVMAHLGPEGFLNTQYVNGKTIVELIALAILSRTDMLLLGEPGVGKTYILDLFTKHCLKDAKLYNHMIFKESGIEELIGPRSVQAMKNDEIRRIIEGFLPTADTAVIDEIFKGSASVLNAMLDLFASRTLKVGGKPIDCSQLITILMASNELPTSEDLLPFRDRIGITYKVEPVNDPDGLRRIIDIQLDQLSHGITCEEPPLTHEELDQARTEVEAIEMPSPVRDQLVQAWLGWLASNHKPSARRVKQMQNVAKAHAWMAGREVVSSNDLLPLQHMAWNHEEHAASARKVVMGFAGQFTKKIERLLTDVQPHLKKMDTARTNYGAAKDKDARKEAYGEMFEAQQELIGLAELAEGYRDEGLRGGEDLTDVEKVLSDLTKAMEWAKSMLVAGMKGE